MKLTDDIEDGAALVHADRASPSEALANRSAPSRRVIAEPGAAGVLAVKPEYGSAACPLVPALQ